MKKRILIGISVIIIILFLWLYYGIYTSPSRANTNEDSILFQSTSPDGQHLLTVIGNGAWGWSRENLQISIKFDENPVMLTTSLANYEGEAGIHLLGWDGNSVSFVLYGEDMLDQVYQVDYSGSNIKAKFWQSKLEYSQ